MKTVVCNASPLIVLAKAEYLDVPRRLFERVVTPKAVEQEILAGPDDDPARIALESGCGIEVVTLEPEVSPLAYWRLGRGETEVIEYARLNPGTVALLDDFSARKAAIALEVPVLGSLGLLARAFKGDVDAFAGDVVKRIEAAGLHADHSVIEAVIAAMKSDGGR